MALELRDDEDALSFLADQVKKGEVILFLGSAVHAPAPDESGYTYPSEDAPPVGAGLSRTLAADSRFLEHFGEKGDPGNLQRVSLFYELKESRKRLVGAIRERVQTGKKPSPVLRALAELDFPLVVTTNYDHLYERALALAGKEPFLSIYDRDPTVRTLDYEEATPRAERPFLVKIHGDVDRPASVVITDEDYIQFVLRMNDLPPNNPVPETFKYHFAKWPTLFVGYSLLDYNLRLLFKTLRWRGQGDPGNFPDTYSVDRDPDPLIRQIWSKPKGYVQFIVQDVWRFVPALYQAVTGRPMPA